MGFEAKVFTSWIPFLSPKQQHQYTARRISNKIISKATPCGIIVAPSKLRNIFQINHPMAYRGQAQKPNNLLNTINYHTR